MGRDADGLHLQLQQYWYYSSGTGTVSCMSLVLVGIIGRPSSLFSIVSAGKGTVIASCSIGYPVYAWAYA